jgi:hypothetical protein
LEFIDRQVGRALGQLGPPVPEDLSRRIWRVLVALAGAAWSERRAFVAWQARGCAEYWFPGFLGVRGRFQNDNGWRVICPPEDQTPVRREIMAKVNRLLRGFWEEERRTP